MKGPFRELSNPWYNFRTQKHSAPGITDVELTAFLGQVYSENKKSILEDKELRETTLVLKNNNQKGQSSNH